MEEVEREKGDKGTKREGEGNERDKGFTGDKGKASEKEGNERRDDGDKVDRL